MAEWTLALPSDIRVTVRARKEPAMLTGFLGPPVPQDAEASLVLDLESSPDGGSRALLALDQAGNSVTVRGVYKAIPWTCRISQHSRGAWTATFQSPVQREYLALHVVLIPLLRRLLLERGTALISGAAFAVGAEGTFVAGPTGQGKTALVLSALESGARLVGDEYLGLRESAALTPFARAVALRRVTFALAPRLREQLGWSRRASLRISELISRVTVGHLQPLVNIQPRELGHPISPEPEAAVRWFFWLEPGPGTGAEVKCEPMTANDAARCVAIMQAAHDLWYGDLGAVFDTIRGGQAKIDYGTRWRETVERGLAGAERRRLTFSAEEGLSREVLRQVLGPSGLGGA